MKFICLLFTQSSLGGISACPTRLSSVPSPCYLTRYTNSPKILFIYKLYLIYFILFYSILLYIILYYIILLYTMLLYIILLYIIFLNLFHLFHLFYLFYLLINNLCLISPYEPFNFKFERLL